MCGGGKKAAPAPAAPVNMGYTYSPADNSNVQRQQAAIGADSAGRAASYGSELGGAPATTTSSGAS